MERILSGGQIEPIRTPGKHIEHVVHAKPVIHVFPDKLYVIAVISNPCRFRSRYELYRAFEKHVEESGAILYTIEMAFGDRLHEITESNNPQHIQLRSFTELWHKENMINIAIGRLPTSAKYIAWIDADMTFTRPDWAQETLHQLQHYKFVQMFSQIQNVSADYCTLPSYHPMGFCYNWVNGTTNNPSISSYDNAYDVKRKLPWLGPPGGAWAATREALDEVGGIPDQAILGSGDSYLAAGLIGRLADFIDYDFTKEYKDIFLTWENLARRNIRRNIGYVPGLLIHHYHGKVSDRGYSTRNNILIKHKFNPLTDIKKDCQGLYQLVDHGDERSIALRDEIRQYFRQRNEDS